MIIGRPDGSCVDAPFRWTISGAGKIVDRIQFFVADRPLGTVTLDPEGDSRQIELPLTGLPRRFELELFVIYRNRIAYNVSLDFTRCRGDEQPDPVEPLPPDAKPGPPPS